MNSLMATLLAGSSCLGTFISIGDLRTVNVLYLTNDLLFSSRVAGIARQLGISLVVAGGVDKLRDLLLSSPAAGILVDLEHPDATPERIVSLADEMESRPALIGYGPHVKEPLLAAARESGFDTVLSRGQFDQKIGQLLQGLVP